MPFLLVEILNFQGSIHHIGVGSFSKVYVEVTVKFSTDGVMMPVEFIWEDGTKYIIDKVKSKERCASRKAGGTGIMYTVLVDGKECHLYYEFDKWFMERKSA